MWGSTVKRPCLRDPRTGEGRGHLIDRGSRCALHQRAVDCAHHNAYYDTKEWRRLRDRTLRAHRSAYGPLCPGWEREPHVATDLTVDHVNPLVFGGGTETQVLCRSCNSRKDARTRREGWGSTKERTIAVTRPPANGEKDSVTLAPVTPASPALRKRPQEPRNSGAGVSERVCRQCEAAFPWGGGGRARLYCFSCSPPDPVGATRAWRARNAE